MEFNDLTEKYNFMVGLKDKPTNIPKGKTQFRGVVFRINTKIFDEVFFIDEGDFDFLVQEVNLEYREQFTLEEFREKFNCLKKVVSSNVIHNWHTIFMEKVGKKLERKFGSNWDNRLWYEYSVFDIEENRWGDFIHYWGRRERIDYS